MFYTVFFVNAQQQIRHFGSCTALQLDMFLRLASEHTREGERCNYRRVAAA